MSDAMTKKELRQRIVKILEEHFTDYKCPNCKKEMDSIERSQIPFIADDILGGFADVIRSFEPSDKDNRLLRRAYNHLTPHRFDKRNKFMVDLNNLIERIKKAKN